MQLLYYHGSGVAHSLTGSDCDTSVHLLSPIVQVSLETHMHVPTKAELCSRLTGSSLPGGGGTLVLPAAVLAAVCEAWLAVHI